MCRWLRLAFIGFVVSIAVERVPALPFCTDVQNNNGTLVIPANTTSIPNYRYSDCFVTDITFNTDGKLKTIGNSAFALNLYFTEVAIPVSVTSINENAFTSCLALEMFEIPESVTLIGPGVLNSCPQLNRVIVHGSSPWTDATSLFNLVNSLCDRDSTPTGQACIEGSGTRASEIINHISNDCNLTFCLTSEDETDTDDDNLSPGAIAGIAVGGTVFLALVAYGIFSYTISSKSSSPKTNVGSLIF